LPIIPSAFYYLDPPYWMEKDQLYKQKTKSREFYKWSQELAKQVKKVVISLADTPEVRLEYKEWKIYQIEKTNTSGRGKKRKTTELIIISK
jgi:site-specific DNA-adenine methylase